MSTEKKKTEINYPPVTIYNNKWIKYPKKEPGRKKRQSPGQKEHQKVISQVFSAYKEYKEQQREEVKRQDKARAVEEEEETRIRAPLNPEQIAENRKKMQRRVFEHLLALREEEESRRDEHDRRRRAQAAEKDKAMEAERQKKLEEKRATMVEMRVYNTSMAEKKRRRDLWEKKTRKD